MISLIKYILPLLATMFTIAETMAQDNNPYPDYREEIFMDMDLEPNILTPEVPDDFKGIISDYMLKTAETLRPLGKIEMMRDADVIVVNIPSDDLFLPNDTLLCKYASSKLEHITKLLNDPYMFKLLAAVHCDDTGSETYRENLTSERLNSIYDWFMDAIDKGLLSEDQVIIPFSMGSNEPILPNDTRKHRYYNRRVEFYFIPGPRLIERARNKKLK